MSYKVETTARFDREFKKLDLYTQKMIKAWIGKNLVNCPDPRAHGKGLAGNLGGQWRYRIGDYRLICQIEDERLVILALSVGHRSDIYKDMLHESESEY
ncbi:MAG: type II toxin-antitoxin system RelE/ParE family toxin [Clostridia bacterium]|nr:type II toxin-antitoxin system RelE/ParE family toxin [Clostridia bacterium]